MRSSSDNSASVSFRRRDLLKWSIVGVGGLAVLKVGGRLFIGAAPPAIPISSDVNHLNPRRAAIVTAAALAMTGPAGEEAYLRGRWDPAVGVDQLLGRLASDQRTIAGVGIDLLEEWCLGMKGFSSWTRERQVALLASWRTSNLVLHRSVWSFLHAATCSSYSATEAGWETMNYPGPNVGTERAPGQSALFTWDEAVP